MAMTDLVNTTKTLLHGAGLGEKPLIVRAATNANETITNPTIVFTLLAGEGAASGIAAGDVLSVVGAGTQALSHVVYVLSVSTDTVTCLSSYDGAPVSVADAFDSAIFEMNAPRSEFLLWGDVSSVIAGLLWPEVYLYAVETIAAPDTTNYQNDLNAATERIVNTQQVIGGIATNIPFELHTNVDAVTVTATGVYAELYVQDSSAAYVSAVRRVIEGSTLNFAYSQCIATGAAAIAAGSMLGGGSLESSSKDSQTRVQLTPRQALWQDFVALRSSISQDLSMEEAYFVSVL